MRKKILMVIVIISFALATGIAGHMDMETEAAGPGYEYIGQTENKTVIKLSEEVADIYPVCPELIQAMAFYESSNRRMLVSKWGDVGYMQVNPRWHKERMDKLGVTDLTDGYANILVGTDYLCELFEQYEDPALVLMAYNMGPTRALELYGDSRISEYAQKILDLSVELERLHGK